MRDTTLLDNATDLALSAATNLDFVCEAEQADVALLEYKLTSMRDPVCQHRARVTIAAIKAGERRYNRVFLPADGAR